MKLLSIAFIALLFISCKKNTPENYTIAPGDPNQKMSADINRAGTDIHLAAIGNSTLFKKAIYPNSVTMINDTVITVLGSSGTHEVTLRLHNVNNAGSYQFGYYTPRQILQATYSPDVAGFGGTYYSNNSTILSGTINITALTSTAISGNFSVSCANGGIVATITNGTFSGSFTP